MKILNKNSKLPQKVSLILGFFDAVHLGHKNVITSAPNEYPRVLITFSDSPAKFFGAKFQYIYPRVQSYNYISMLGVDYLVEYDFADLAQMTANEYLQMLSTSFNPKFIVTGYNHTFGRNKKGDNEFLIKNQSKYLYNYICVPEFKIFNEVVSSTNIKEYLKKAQMDKAKSMLGRSFSLSSKVKSGLKLGRELGFPTANLDYPENVVRIPYGVYFARVLGLPSVLNWGIKPTIGGTKEVLEVHIIGYNGNLYNKELTIEIIKKLRDEQKFESLDLLKVQIKEDIRQCLEL